MTRRRARDYGDAARYLAAMQSWSQRLLLVVLAAAISPACADEQKPASTASSLQYTENSRRAYEEAMAPYKDRDWLTASTLMHEVKRRFSFSEYAPLAQLRIADIEYAQDKWTDAIGQYKTFMRENPKHHETAYARMRIARCYYNQISDAFLLPPQSQRDQAAIIDAAREIRSYLEEFPEGPERAEMIEIGSNVLGRLVDHELVIARYYVGKEKLEAALNRVDYALARYKGSHNYVEALILRGDVLLRLKRPAEAKATFEIVVKQFPTDPRTIEAQNYLDRINKGGA